MDRTFSAVGEAMENMGKPGTRTFGKLSVRYAEIPRRARKGAAVKKPESCSKVETFPMHIDNLRRAAYN